MKTTNGTFSRLIQSIITVCIFTAIGIAQNTLSIEVGDGSIDVLYNSDADIGGFQFTVEGATVTGASGGDAAANGFMVSCNSTMCLGFSMTGAVIPAGSGTLVVVSADITGDVSLTGIVVSDAGGNALDFSFDSGSEEPDYIVEVSNNVFTPDHLDIAAGETVEWVNMGGFHNVDGSTDTYPNNPDSFYSGSASSDSWTYSFTFTVAGNYDYECNPHAPGMAGTVTVGSGGCTDDMACNYDSEADFDDGSCLENDCAGECGGSAVVDECGVCGGNGIDEGECDCAGNVDLGCGCGEAGPSGCDNACGSTLENDECGVCGGSGIADGACDCAGNVDDCAGICGGSTEVDECGVCGGPGATGECGCDGIAEGTCDCAGNVLDECGVCGGDGIAEGSCDCVGNVDLGCGCGEAGPSGCDNACGSTLENDECGVCGGDGIADGECDCEGSVEDCAGECGGSAAEDCAGECGGSAEFDECGVCGGDGTSCTSIIDILYNTTTDIGGFQFNVDGVTILSVSGGAAEDAGFSSSYGNNTVLGFSFTGATIPAGSGVLVQVEVDGDTGAACLSAVVLSDPVGVAIDNEVIDCFTISQVEIILGCTDETACNYNVDATDDDGNCEYPEENYDCDGNCIVEIDCAGECGGSVEVDECGECGGDGIGGHACDCDGNVEDCAGECGGSAVEDDCGVCGGDGTSCIPVQLGFGTVADGNMEITYDSPADIAGFQFYVSGVNVISAGGGDAADAGFSMSTGNNTVLGFSFTGGTIPAGSGVLIELTYEATADQACLEDPVVSDTNGEGFDIEIGACADLDFACDDVDADGICDDVDDCVGAYDECGICNGDGIADGACDCDGNVEDCAGICGGDSVVDECGECGGDGIDEGACDCDGNVDDCAGVCGGDAVVDECGECGGDGIADGACDCDGNVADCAGECGGSAENCPDWTEGNPNWYGAYQFPATISVGIVLSDGVNLAEEGDLFGAFDAEGALRGLGVQLPAPFGPYAGQLYYETQVWSNVDGDILSFKYYDASEDAVLDISETYTFVTNDNIGDLITGAIFFNIGVNLSIDLIAGYNWISFNVVPEDASLAGILGSLGTDANFVASQSDGVSNNYGDYGWYGSLADLSPTQMYLVEMLAPATLTITGVPVDVASTPISLIAGYNWIGYLPQNSGALAVALESLGTDANFVASQSDGVSNNYGDYGWYGSLATLEPGNGYLLEMLAEGELIYPDFDGLARLSENKQEVVLSNKISDWDFNYSDYRYIGTITASIESREDFDGDVVGVFVDDECRGVAERMDFPFNDSYMYIIQTYSNVEDGEELTFKYYDKENDEVVEYSETLTFENYMNVGDGFNTFALSRERDLSQPSAYGISEAYPNPFNPVTSFEYTLEKDGMVNVAVYDINGRQVAELANGFKSAGTYPVVWDAQELSSGVYLVNMISGDYSTIQKVMLIK